MALRDATAGPDDIYSTARLPSRGQWETMAQLACELFGIPIPQNRLEATLAICRLKLTESPPSKAPEINSF
jgi:hypothetical protein